MTRELKGKHVLGIMVGAFGVIIAVNLYMAFSAVSTFPGLETANSYVTSQSFDRDRVAQEALGWTVASAYDDKVLTLAITDEAGEPAEVRTLQVNIGRPTHVREDQALTMTYLDGVFSAPVDLSAGAWLIHLNAEASDGTPFRQRLDNLVVKGDG